MFISSCRVQLAPTFNKELITGSTEANKEILGLFSSIENGAEKITSNDRLPKYDKLIGSFEALAVQSNARMIPNDRLTASTNKFINTLTIKGIKLSDAETDSLSEGIPSTFALGTIAKTIKAMKNQDIAGGIPAPAVKVFKNPFLISMSQALIHENALER